ncbi:MAG: membrane dipeptidase [Pseudomonadota bacterium]
MQVFDGHNDVLSRLWRRGDDPVAAFEQDEAHINAVACKAGGFAGGFFAIYCPEARKPAGDVFQEDGLLEEPLPDPLDHDWALNATIGQVGVAKRLEAAGHLRLVITPEDLQPAFDADPMACILNVEGAEGIGPDLLELETLHAAGVRSLGPVWSRPNIFGHGVPFAHKRDGDTGPGLTEHGKRLAQRCAQLGIMLDCSHITMRGFWDIAELGRPVVATHSNAWTLCQSSRNLTDDQLACIRETGGIAGFNFEPAFISEAGWKTGKASLEDCLRQLDYMIEKLGEDHVALGSDFDGARTPQGIASAADLPVLVDAMERAGYHGAVIEKICNKNWLGFLTRHLGGT